MSAGVKRRDEVIVEDFFVHWEDLLGLTGVLRDKERKIISKALEVIRLKEDARLIGDSEFWGIFNITFIRSQVSSLVYLVFNFSPLAQKNCSTQILLFDTKRPTLVTKLPKLGNRYTILDILMHVNSYITFVNLYDFCDMTYSQQF